VLLCFTDPTARRVRSQTSRARHKESSSTQLSHRSITRASAAGSCRNGYPSQVIIIPTAACEVELFLAACSITCIPNLEEPVMGKAHTLLFIRRPMLICVISIWFFLIYLHVLIICLYQSKCTDGYENSFFFDTIGSAWIARTQLTMSSSIPSTFIMLSARTWSELV